MEIPRRSSHAEGLGVVAVGQYTVCFGKAQLYDRNPVAIKTIQYILFWSDGMI